MNNIAIRISSLLLIFLCMYGCMLKKSELKTTIIKNNIKKSLPFEIDKKRSLNNFDSIFQTARVIKLETNRESLICDFKKIEYNNNKIYVIDSYSEYSVTCFDDNGKFRFKLKNLGRGPGEYISFGDANINKSTGDIELLVKGRQIMVYDSIGVYKQTIKLPYFANKFCCFEGIRFFYKNYTIENEDEYESFRLYSLDTNGTIEKYLKFKANRQGVKIIGHDNFSRFSENEYRFIERYNDTIYSISTKGIEAICNVNFPGYENNKPDDFLSNIEKYSDREKSARKLSIPFLFSYSEFGNFIVGYYRKFIHDIPGIFYYIFDKEKNTIVHNINYISYGELDVSGDYFYPEFIMNNNPCAVIQPYEIYRMIERQTNSTSKEKIKSFFNYDGEVATNPYIVVYKF